MQNISVIDAIRSLKVLNQSVTVNNVLIGHNAKHNNQLGMWIHVDFTISRCVGHTCSINLYFNFKNGVSLKDRNGKYRTESGEVATSSEAFVPPYTSSTYGDFPIFFPYEELHLARGTHQLTFDVKIYDHDLSKFVGGSSGYQIQVKS